MTVPRPDSESIFHAARALADPDRRRAFVREACGGDPEWGAVIEAMLSVADRPDSLLDRPVGSAETVDQPTVPCPGQAIGPYKLLEQLGEGGFGVVFLAEQTQPVRRKVALKLLKPGMDTRQVVARFEAERQALALMDHPNIARVFDGGATAAGRPYFVMELVKGVPITEFCDQHQFPPRQRLELFVTVCAAVQHAHQKGIIHRDLKPSNILVSRHDTTPVVKVIDFGVAKALGQELTDKTLHTGVAQMVGTPLYMSPEQAGMSDLDVDTRSDVYSLGVLLYELLTGTTPFEKERFKQAGYDEIRRIIREEEPPKPSTRLSTLARAGSTIAEARGSHPRKLSRLFRGELDWVVMKALEKDRNRRYESASAFALDVQRYLNDEPVLACPPTVGYRLGKFFKRHKGPVVAAVLGSLSLVGGGGGVTFGLLWNQAKAARVEALTARDNETKAKGEAQDAREALAAVEYGHTTQLALQAWSNNDFPTALALLNGTRVDLRGWEWRYVHRLCHSELVAFRGHTDRVWSASFSPDGLRVFTASHDGTARVWDVKTGAEILNLRHADAVWVASFSPDGSRLITGCADRTARVWDAKTGGLIHILAGHSYRVLFAQFSQDGSRILTSGDDSIARVWDATTGSKISTLEHPEGFLLTTMSLSPDGLRAVTTTFDGSARVPSTRGDLARVWDTTTGTEVLTLEHGSSVQVRTATFSPDGARIVTGSTDQMARIWNARTGDLVRTLKGHTDHITPTAFRPDGKQVVTGSRDRTLRVWDVETGDQVLALAGHEGSVDKVSFSPDGSSLISHGVDDAVRVWDARTGVQIRTIRNPGFAVSVASNSDGSRIVTAAGGDQVVRLWDGRTSPESVTLRGHSGAVFAASFNRNGSRVVTSSIDGTSRVWDTSTGAELLTLRGRVQGVRSASLSPDGTRILALNNGPTALVLDARTGAELLELKGHTDNLWSGAFSPDGSRVVTASFDGTARVWDAATGDQLHTLRGHSKGVYSVAFSPDGSRLITSSEDRTVRVWDAATGAELNVLRGPQGLTGQVMNFGSTSFSPDWTRVVTSDQGGTIRVWAATTGDELFTINHADRVHSASFSPDGSRLVTCGSDKTARVWDAWTGAELFALKSPTGDALGASFSPDGSRLATAGTDHAVRVWDARTGAEVLILKGRCRFVHLVSWSNDGSKLLTYGNSGAEVWDASSPPKPGG